jgi:hypothetical protein
MVLVPDGRAVEWFAAAGVYPAFHDRVHPGHADAGEHHLDPGIREDRVELQGICGVPVPDQKPRAMVGVFQVHDEVSCGLGDQGSGGVSGGTEDPDPSAGVLHHREHVPADAGQGDGNSPPRALFAGQPVGARIWIALAWCVGIFVVDHADMVRLNGLVSQGLDRAPEDPRMVGAADVLDHT